MSLMAWTKGVDWLMLVCLAFWRLVAVCDDESLESDAWRDWMEVITYA